MNQERIEDYRSAQKDLDKAVAANADNDKLEVIKFRMASLWFVMTPDEREEIRQEEAKRKEGKTIPRREISELRLLAVDICEMKVFTDRYCPPHELPRIFMPIALGGLSDWTKEEAEQIGMIYEYYSEAGPGSVNGFPHFMSFRMLGKEDANLVCGFIREWTRSRDAFLGKAEQPKTEPATAPGAEVPDGK
jgi:hypothetical protein